jgi:hypothetical protein
MSNAERRRHVRVKPTADLPARVALGVESLVRETAEVHDVSVGGLALGSKQLASSPPGAKVLLELMLGTYGDHRVDVEIRWTAGDLVGVELVAPKADAAQAISRYVSELLERGNGG